DPARGQRHLQTRLARTVGARPGVTAIASFVSVAASQCHNYLRPRCGFKFCKLLMKTQNSTPKSFSSSPASLPALNSQSSPFSPRSRRLSRRMFLGSTTAVAAFSFLPARVLGRGEASPNNKLNIHGVGIGGQGASDLEQVTSENIVALCDVDWDYAAHTFKKYPNAKRYKDFREMLDKEKN